MHPSILKVGLRLEAHALDETLFTCPLCPKLKTSAKKMNGHMEGHINMAVHFKDKVLCRCNLQCRRLPHYHCPYCLRTIIKMKDAGIHVKACYFKTTSPLWRPSPLPQPPAMTNSVLLQDHNYALEAEHCMGTAEMLLPSAVTDTVTPGPLDVPNAVTLEPLGVANTVTLEPLDVPNAVILEPPAVSDESLTHSAAIDAESSQSLVFPAMQDHDYLQKSTLSDSSSVSPEALDLRSSRVKYLKVVKCPHCALVLYKKNLATHIQRKHTKTKGNTATYHLKCVCVDQTHEEYAVQEESSFSVPVHVQHKTHTKCEAGVCGQNQLLALKGGLTSLCQHIQSLDSGVNTAADHFLKAEVLDEMLAFKEMLNSHLRPLKDLVK